MSTLRRLKWPLVAASASALTMVAVAGAGHDTTTVYDPAQVMHLNVLNNQNPVGTTVRDCNIGGANFKPACFRAFNFSTDSGVGLDGTHGGSTGTGPGVVGDTASVSPNATGVLGIVSSPSSSFGSAGVRAINNGNTGNIG